MMIGRRSAFRIISSNMQRVDGQSAYCRPIVVKIGICTLHMINPLFVPLDWLWLTYSNLKQVKSHTNFSESKHDQLQQLSNDYLVKVAAVLRFRLCNCCKLLDSSLCFQQYYTLVDKVHVFAEINVCHTPRAHTHFFFIRRFGPSIYCLPPPPPKKKKKKKNQEYPAPEKIYGIFATQKIIPILYIYLQEIP